MTRATFVLAVVAMALCAVVGYSFGYMAGTPHAAPVVAEDSPQWDCATMGNHVCGRGTATGDAQLLVLMCSLYWRTDANGAVHVSFSDPAGYDECLRTGGNDHG